MSTTMTKTKIDAFVNSILYNSNTFDAEKRVKAKSVLRSLPLGKSAADDIIALDDIDFSPIAQQKQQQRFEDVQTALEDAVEQGVGSIDEFSSWLGLQSDEEVNDIMDFAHAYVRLGKRKNPQSMSDFLNAEE